MRYHGPLGVAHGIHTDGTLHADAGTAAGFMTAAMVTKLAGIETAADVTDATNVLAALVGQTAYAAVFGAKVTGTVISSLYSSDAAGAAYLRTETGHPLCFATNNVARMYVHYAATSAVTIGSTLVHGTLCLYDEAAGGSTALVIRNGPNQLVSQSNPFQVFANDDTLYQGIDRLGRSFYRTSWLMVDQTPGYGAEVNCLGLDVNQTFTVYGREVHSPGARSGTPSASAGSYFDAPAATFTDSTTEGSTTAAAWAARSIAIPTLVATNALVTTTEAATVRIMGPPAASTNETITQGAALQIVTGAIVLNNATGANAEWGRIYWSGNGFYIDTAKTGSGTVRNMVVGCAANTYIIGGGVYLQTGSANRLGFNSTGVGAVGPSATSGTPSATVGSFWNHVTATFTDNVTGDISTAAGFAAVSIQGYTLAATHTSVTTTKVCTLYVGAPILGTNETFTASYAAHFAAAIRVDAAAAISGAGGAATLAATTGGATGPATAAQNEWVRIDTNSGVRYVPAWA